MSMQNDGTSGQQRSVNVDQAAQTLNDSMDLGLTADDLGMDREDTFADLDLGDDLDPNTGDALEPQPELRRQQEQDQQPEPRNRFDLGEPRQQPNQQQPNQQQQRQLPQSALVRPDDKGNLVDRNGNVIARAGAEARHYQRFAQHFEGPLRNAATVIQQTRSQVAQTEGRVQEAVQIGEQLLAQVNQLRAQVNNDLPTQYGLNKDEHLQALNLARMAKNDPIQAIKSMLTMAASRGIDLKSVLGPNAGNAFDPKAFLDLMRQELGAAVQPLKERTQQEQQTAEVARQREARIAEIQNDAKSFFSRTPDARPYFEMFRQVKTNPQYSNLSMDHIWSQIQLDIARRGHTPQSWLNAQRAQRQNGQSMPQGGRPRGFNNGGGDGDSRQPAEQMAPVAQTYEQIIREILG